MLLVNLPNPPSSGIQFEKVGPLDNQNLHSQQSILSISNGGLVFVTDVKLELNPLVLIFWEALERCRLIRILSFSK